MAQCLTQVAKTTRSTHPKRLVLTREDGPGKPVAVSLPPAPPVPLAPTTI